MVALLISSNLVGLPQVLAIESEKSDSSDIEITDTKNSVDTNNTDTVIETSDSQNSSETSSNTTSDTILEKETEEKRFQSSNPEIQAIIDSYTEEDLANAVGEDGLGERIKEDSPIASPFASYPNVNQYIQKNKFKNPIIKKDSRAGMLPKIPYKYGHPIGIVIHETANPNSTINGEVNFMYGNYRNAFVHAFASNGEVIETADTNYLAWGAGRYANPLFLHIELVESKSFHSFAQSVNSDAFWVALQLHNYGLLPSFGDNNGIGTVISHNAISRFYGGTTHTDPYGYFAKWGYSMSEFYKLVELKYQEIADDTNKPDISIEKEENINTNMKIANVNEFFYKTPITNNSNDKISVIGEQFKVNSPVKVIKRIIMSDKTESYQLANNLYVKSNALKPYATIKQTEDVNRYMKVVKDNYYLYNKPYNTQGAARQGKLINRYNMGASILVQKKMVTSENVTVYLLENGQYVDHRALKDFHKVIKTDSINQTMRIDKLNYYMYNNPYGTIDSKRIYQLNKKFKINDEIYVTNRLVTNAGVTIYQINGMGYVDHRALKPNATIKTEVSADLKWRIVKPKYNVYSQPYRTQGSKIIQPLQRYFDDTSRNVTITKKVTTSDNVTTYYIKGLGWVDYRAVAPHTTIAKEKNLNLSQVIINEGYYIYSHPYGTAGYERVEKLSSYVKRHGKNVTVTKEVTTSGGTTVLQLKGIGWVDKRAVADGQAYKMKQVQNLLNRKYNQNRFGVHVISLTDGSTASVNPNKSYTAASTGKLPAIYYTQKRLNNGSLKPNQSFLYHDRINQMSGYSYQRGGAGILQGKSYGGYYTIDTILKWTIEYSDNQGANFLGYYGANQFNSAMRKEISQIIGRTWQSPFTITAKENAQLMRAIYYQGGSANKYLQNTVYDNQRIPKYLPVKVGHKIGDVYDYRHDVAIVYAKQPYVLSVMTSNYTSYETISLMSKEIYDILK